MSWLCRWRVDVSFASFDSVDVLVEADGAWDSSFERFCVSSAWLSLPRRIISHVRAAFWTSHSPSTNPATASLYVPNPSPSAALRAEYIGSVSILGGAMLPFFPPALAEIGVCNVLEVGVSVKPSS